MSKWVNAKKSGRYTYGRKFKRNGKMVQYRYTYGRKSTKKLVPARKRR